MVAISWMHNIYSTLNKNYIFMENMSMYLQPVTFRGE